MGFNISQENLACLDPDCGNPRQRSNLGLKLYEAPIISLFLLVLAAYASLSDQSIYQNLEILGPKQTNFEPEVPQNKYFQGVSDDIVHKNQSLTN